MPAPVSVWDAKRARALLGDIGTLLDGANEAERRAALRYLFGVVWLERHRVVALTPTALYAPMLAAVERVRVGEGCLGCPTGINRPLFDTSMSAPTIWTAHQSVYELAA